jgi:hypothetical protein
MEQLNSKWFALASTNLLKKHLGQKIVVFHIFKINYLKNEEID